MSNRPHFREFAERRLTEINKSTQQLATLLGLSKQAIYRWFKDNKWPEYDFPTICDFLELNFNTKSEAEELYEIGWTRPRRRSLAAETSGYETALDALEQQDELPGAEAAVAGLFAEQGQRHFTCISSRTIQPGPFRVNACPVLVESVYGAMDSGALFAFILPTEGHIHHLGSYYRFTQLHPYRSFMSGFEEFRSGYIRRRLAAGDPSPEQTTDLRTQLFRTEEFPLTPCGRTMTLVGETAGHGQVAMRVLERGPGSHGRVALVPENRLNEERMRLYAEVVMQAAVANDRNGTGSDRLRFVTAFVERMYGFLE